MFPGDSGQDFHMINRIEGFLLQIFSLYYGKWQLGGLALFPCETQFRFAQGLKGAQCRQMQDIPLEVERNWESGKTLKKPPVAAFPFMQMGDQSLSYSL